MLLLFYIIVTSNYMHHSVTLMFVSSYFLPSPSWLSWQVLSKNVQDLVSPFKEKSQHFWQLWSLDTKLMVSWIGKSLVAKTHRKKTLAWNMAAAGKAWKEKPRIWTSGWWFILLNQNLEKQQDLGASGFCWQDQGSYEELQKPRFAKGGPREPCGPPFAIGPNFDLSISPANWVPNNCNRREKARFGSLWPFLTRSGKFRRVAEISFCQGGTAWAMWFPLCHWAELRCVDISRQASGKQSQSTAHSRIWEPLAFAYKIRKVSKICRNLVL